MVGCNGNCQHNAEKKAAPEDEKKIYICSQCNTFTAAPVDRPAPECCGEKMKALE
jgi:hypothetical protein